MARKTTKKNKQGGLTKKDLIQNKWGEIVSRKKHMTDKKRKTFRKIWLFC